MRRFIRTGTENDVVAMHQANSKENSEQARKLEQERLNEEKRVEEIKPLHDWLSS